MKAVAERLGVSLAGLYYHVRGRDELLRIIAEHSVGGHRLPEDRGQSWWEWLREWAYYIRWALSSESEVLSQYMTGTIGAEQMKVALERVLDLLIRRGFAIGEAYEAFRATSYTAMGAALEDVRESHSVQRGHPFMADLVATVERERSKFPRLAGLVGAPPDIHSDEAFDQQLETVFIGIAVRRGEDWAAIVSQDDKPGPSRRQRRRPR